MATETTDAGGEVSAGYDAGGAGDTQGGSGRSAGGAGYDANDARDTGAGSAGPGGAGGGAARPASGGGTEVTPEAVRAEVRAWLAEAWDPDLPLAEWRRRLVDAGWAVPSWPADRYGRGLPGWADGLVAQELDAAGAPGPPVGVGMVLAAPTLLAHASDDLVRRLVPGTLTGELTWCQLFSEPGSGSDLAGLTTRAVRDGDEWVVDGQKLWSTSAHHADYAMLLARTDWDAPKHAGITYFALPLRQPGVDVRPLRQMNGYASFNEVFLSGARVPDRNVVGAPGDGWRVARTTLAHERRFGTIERPRRDRAGRAAAEAVAEADEHMAAYVWYPQRAGRVDLVVEQARKTGRAADPIVRQKVAALLTLERVHRWTARRAAAARARGRPPGPEGSLGKLAASQVARAAAEVHALVAGPAATIGGEEGAAGGLVAEVLVSVPAQSIAGGTDEIQRNIIGERVLGLPAEKQIDRDRPFRDVLRSTQLGGEDSNPQ
ncbi:MAG TPA: acyl-CoA dehydrogenase family protein [Acidimicrobiales bacterium]